ASKLTRVSESCDAMVKLTVTQPETAIEARTSASQCQFEPASVVVSDCEGAMEAMSESSKKSAPKLTEAQRALRDKLCALVPWDPHNIVKRAAFVDWACTHLIDPMVEKEVTDAGRAALR